MTLVPKLSSPMFELGLSLLPVSWMIPRLVKIAFFNS
jgi:hypothetical protein